MPDERSSQPALKRQRIDDTEESSHTSAIRHEKHWYSDGSIVLHVDNTLFRVHQTILAGRSAVFKDMLQVPQPVAEEMEEGCHVVRMAGDESCDWCTLLDALYNSMEYFDQLSTEELDDSFTAISSILRLSTKYRITVFRRKCIYLLSQGFPSTSDYWEPDTIPEPKLAAQMIMLGRATNATTLLPSAFLLAASGPKDKIYEGIEISAADKNILYHGLLIIWRSQTGGILPFVYEQIVPSECQLGGCVKPAYFSPQHLHSEQGIYLFGLQDIVSALREDEYTICDACEQEVRRIITQGQQELWVRLPQIFMLGKDWKELKRLQEYDDDLEGNCQ
ncbi:hypothetical protein BD626DRAFT_499536 [Schizophyllum amplum]|uniref:BTB domain-containing protein n=1 Tax=Schizophyllum amplum TaxID=97359 RepID=A0A550CB46_9AGAR|nr:hypothetical protein BD626DRAFT_499536 [Auriculariopsis ampla]